MKKEEAILISKIIDITAKGIFYLLKSQEVKNIVDKIVSENRDPNQKEVDEINEILGEKTNQIEELVNNLSNK